MREILFRGKRVDNGKWECGFHVMYSRSIAHPYSYTDGDHYIQTVPHNMKFKVDPDTVCQYTGLRDKNGKKIFEGDIVQEQDDKCVGIVRYGVYDSSFNSDGLGGHMGFYIEWKEGRIKLRRIDIVFWSDVIEVIGNIFDNPELMETDYE